MDGYKTSWQDKLVLGAGAVLFWAILIWSIQP